MTGNDVSIDMISIPADNRILYFARDRAQFGFLSHFHPSPILLDGEAWPTVEHYYQAQKSPDPDYRAAIREAIHAGRAKSLAAQPKAPRRISRHAPRRPRQVRAEPRPAGVAAGDRQRRAGRGFADRAVLGHRPGRQRPELGRAGRDGGEGEAAGLMIFWDRGRPARS
jgi:hypothetical protein